MKPGRSPAKLVSLSILHDIEILEAGVELSPSRCARLEASGDSVQKGSSGNLAVCLRSGGGLGTARSFRARSGCYRWLVLQCGWLPWNVARLLLVLVSRYVNRCLFKIVFLIDIFCASVLSCDGTCKHQENPFWILGDFV